MYNWRNAKLIVTISGTRDEADRDLKKTLTMLGFDDKRDERRERSVKSVLQKIVRC